MVSSFYLSNNSLTNQILSLSVMPPYIDVIANLFSANVMRKNGATAPGARNTGLSGTKTATMKNLTSARTQGRTTPYKR